jgi:hypothetical protein
MRLQSGQSGLEFGGKRSATPLCINFPSHWEGIKGRAYPTDPQKS